MQTWWTSIQSRLTIGLISLSLILVLAFAFLAKTTFESDKIAYIFSTQNAELESLAEKFSLQVERLILIARTSLLSPQSGKSSQNQEGLSMIESEDLILAFELRNEHQKSIQEALTKPSAKLNSKMPAPLPEESFVGDSEVEAFPVTQEEMLLVAKKKNDRGELMSLRILAKFPAPVVKSMGQTLLVAKGQVPLSASGNNSEHMGPDFVKLVLAKLGPLKNARTEILSVNNEDYLTSSLVSPVGGLSFILLTPKNVALDALNILYHRATYFLLVAFLAVLLIAYLMSRGLTSGLSQLTEIAGQIGQGRFDSDVSVHSRDEVGVLASAFQKMKSEIQRLLIETAEKARMQSELETAKTVQETLFPPTSKQIFGRLEVVGHYRSASECGGDWWWAFQSGEKAFVLIADATGHGVPAALLTSAARSAVAVLEDNANLTLEHFTETLNKAIRKTALGRRTMSAFLLEVDLKTGLTRFVNASHIPAILLTKAGPESWRDLPQIFKPVSSPLGITSEPHEIGELMLEPGFRLVLLTDGLTERKMASGEMMTDRKFAKLLLAAQKAAPESLETLILKLFELSDEISGQQPQEDDLTVVAIQIM